MSDALGGPLEPQDKQLPLTILYMRFVALLLLVAGLAHACQVLGIFTPDGLTFADLSPARRSGAITLVGSTRCQPESRTQTSHQTCDSDCRTIM